MIVVIDKIKGVIIEVLTEWSIELKAINLEGKAIALELVIVLIVEIIVKYY